MAREQQFKDTLAVFAQSARISPDYHSCSRNCRTRRHHSALFVLDHAHTASAVNGQIRMIAENREFYSALADNFKEIPFTLDLNWDAVYFDKIL